MKVILADADFSNTEREQAVFADAGIELLIRQTGTQGDPAAVASDAAGLLVMWERVSDELLARLPDLRVVGRFGTGVDRIDVESATRRGIAVVNSGHFASAEVTGHTIAMVLALCRRLLPGDRAVRSGDWSSDGVMNGVRRFSEIRIGVIGLGHIGCLVANQLATVGFPVRGYDPVGRPPDVQLAPTLEDLLRSSDLVTFHVPLTDSTRQLLNQERLALLPAGALVVNTSRGEVVDQEALVAALQSGALGGAALDVFEHEPLSPSHVLCHLRQVMLTPHVAYYSEESLDDARSQTVNGMIEVLRGGRPPSVVNPSIWTSR